MIIVSGKIYVRPGAREQFRAASLEAVAQARRSRGCRDSSWRPIRSSPIA
jgi:quinol monooxygenase YgiN